MKAGSLVLVAALACGLSACTTNVDDTPGAGAASSPAAVNLVGQVDPALREQFPAAVRSSGVLRLAADPTYPPSTFKDDSGKLIGIMPDLATAVASRAGLKVDWVQVPFDGMLAGLGAHRFDASWSAWSITAEREKQLNMVAFLEGGTSVLVKSGNPAGLKTATDLCGRNIAVQTGTTQAQQVADELGQSCAAVGKPALKLLQLPQQTDVNQAVATGRADALLADNTLVGYQAKIQPGVFAAVPTIFVDPVKGAVAVRKEDTQLAGALTGAFNAIIEDGTYTKILQRWNIPNEAITKAELNPVAR
jgi:polar amino acid transport system substrate-binding protein